MSVSLDIGGRSAQALPGRALWLPDAGTLVIADLHLGKGEVFRRAGIPVPRGGTAADLARLGGLVAATGARRLLVVGDLVHGPVPADAGWLRAWSAWRTTHAGLELALVGGNHDRHLDPARLGFKDAGEVLHEGGLCFRHEPAARGATHVVAGHLHPVARLRTRTLGARLPAFWLRPAMTVLPAFSAFTGGFEPPPGDGGRLLACLPDALVAVPLRRPRGG